MTALGDAFSAGLNSVLSPPAATPAAPAAPATSALAGWDELLALAAPAAPRGASAPFRGDLRQGILEAAAELGISPLDLATTISYETAGTFDPMKRGPTTKWGQHRGLIQFGEPQARQYGVDWNDPIGSQLGRGGAVVQYLRATGVRPGMGLLDVYSAINAGGVGRYGARDAAAGGAPGTVREKVEQQMAGHRRNAERLLGTNYSPSPAPQPMNRLWLDMVS